MVASAVREDAMRIGKPYNRRVGARITLGAKSLLKVELRATVLASS